MKNSADLGECYPPRPLASVDNTLLDLQNSSYPTQPHSIIAKYKYVHVYMGICVDACRYIFCFLFLFVCLFFLLFVLNVKNSRVLHCIVSRVSSP